MCVCVFVLKFVDMVFLHAKWNSQINSAVVCVSAIIIIIDAVKLIFMWNLRAVSCIFEGKLSNRKA